MSTVTFGQITGDTVPMLCRIPVRYGLTLRLVPPTDTAAAKNIVEEAVKAAEAELQGSGAVTSLRVTVLMWKRTAVPGSGQP